MNSFVTIGLTGDVMLGRTLDYIIDHKGYNYPWGDILRYMQAADLNIINLETTLTPCRKAVNKTFNFRAFPDKVRCLENAHVTVANLANNHMLDFGPDGLADTIRALDETGILHVGAGANIREATAPAIITRKDITIGVLGATDNEPGWRAGDKPGIRYVNISDAKDRAALLRAVRKLEKETDIVIVSLHWGPNMQEAPEKNFIDFAHALADHGADIIHGHSAHILQGIEYYGKAVILYDTGDFVDDYIVDPVLRNDLAAFFMVRVSRSGVEEMTIIPTRIFAFQVNQARHEDRLWVEQRIGQLSAAFNTTVGASERIHLLPSSQSSRNQIAH